MKILLAEDDPNLGVLIQEYLSAKGFYVQLSVNGEAAFSVFLKEKWNLCILDVMMPLMDGFTLAREIRKHNKDIPIVFLTAKTMRDDAIEGFKAGADDYITKPFSMEELLMRIRAILKRTEKGSQDVSPSEYRIGRYSFNPTLQQLSLDNNMQRLTTRESELLLLLCQHKNDLLERNFALRSIWMSDQLESGRSMDVYITKLRKYLSGDSNIEILNIHGKGFRLVDPSELN
jgi:two-component system, OmpR family, response regulator